MCLRRVYPEAGIPLITLSADKLCKKLIHQPQISLHSRDKLSHNIISHARMSPLLLRRRHIIHVIHFPSHLGFQTDRAKFRRNSDREDEETQADRTSIRAGNSPSLLADQ